MLMDGGKSALDLVRSELFLVRRDLVKPGSKRDCREADPC